MWTAAYIGCVVFVNWMFTALPLVTLPTGDKWTYGSLVVGLIFVIRDLSQREIGHKIWIAMFAGAGLSYWMASPFVAVASVAAFLTAEAADWSIYTYTRRPMSERVLWSSVVSTPIDSAVFLLVIGHLTLAGVAAQVASKMLGALVVWHLLRRREKVS